MSTSNPTVLIDSRKGRQDQRWSYDLLKLSPLDEYGIECQLDSADAIITGNGPHGAVTIGVEVKSLGSLLSGLSSGRLQTQAVKMLDTYSYSYLLYFGPYKIDESDNDNGKRTIQVPRGGSGGNRQWSAFNIGSRTFPFGYLHNALLELSVLGIQSIHFNNVSMVAEWIGCTARWWNKKWTDHSLFRVLDSTQQQSGSSRKLEPNNDGGLSTALLPGIDSATKLKMKVASAFDGMGFERSLAAAEHFTSVSAMISASESEWLKVPGIGKVLARSITESARR